MLTGKLPQPSLIKLKHFGAAAASSGGVEMYHIPGVTPEARDVEEAFGGRQRRRRCAMARRNAEAPTTSSIAPTDRRRRFRDARLPAQRDRSGLADRRAAGRPEDQRQHPALGVTPRAPLREVADRNGYTKMITDAGGFVMSDTCPAISRHMPKGTKVVATDSAKQAHYLPAIIGVPAWFGSVKDCVEAAITGRWNGGLQ